MRRLYQGLIGLAIFLAIIPIDYFHPFDFISGNLLDYATGITGLLIMIRTLEKKPE